VKGGVGKTTSAASWGLSLSDSGLNTLVVSTDPAHSLGDSLQEQLSGTPRLLDRSSEGGSLWAMEIDPVSALAEFQQLVKEALSEDESSSASSSSGFLGGLGLSGIKKDLGELISGANDPPPGTDGA
jgi:arsenite-transporting ATPase